MGRLLGGMMALVAGAALACLGAGTAAAQGSTAQQLQEQWNKDVVGKTVVYIPVAYSVPLTRIWGERMQMIAQRLGIKFQVRDPNFDTQREEQLLEAEIGQHPDVLIVHNPNVQVLAPALQRAENAGIYVIQINMASRYKSDAFIGVQPNELGVEMADAVVNACGAPTSRSSATRQPTGIPRPRTTRRRRCCRHIPTCAPIWAGGRARTPESHRR
jgi:ABC-type sugar transport system substrate-binding protein